MSKFSLGSLPGRSSTPDTLPPWRADFRRKEELPDVKVIRTGFLLNYGLVGLAVIGLGFALYREYTYMGLRSEINALSAEIDSKKSRNQQDLKSSGVYTQEMKYVEEFIRFKTPPVDCLRVLSEIGSVKSDDMNVTNISVDASLTDAKTKKPLIKVMVVGNKQGVNPASFSAIEDSFKKLGQLPVWKDLKGFMPDPAGKKSPLVTVNTQQQLIDFTLELTLVPTK